MEGTFESLLVGFAVGGYKITSLGALLSINVYVEGSSVGIIVGSSVETTRSEGIIVVYAIVGRIGNDERMSLGAEVREKEDGSSEGSNVGS